MFAAFYFRRVDSTTRRCRSDVRLVTHFVRAWGAATAKPCVGSPAESGTWGALQRRRRKQMRRLGKTALLVDDHPEIRNQIRAFLRRLGFETVEAGDARSAIDRLSTCRPDMICLDLVLPDSSGYDICEFIRRSPVHGATPILMMSDRTYPEDRAHAAEAGADAFLAKPITEKALRERIESLFPRGERSVGS